MAKTFISASISTGNTIEAGHVTQSSDAFTGTEAYDITISGSLNIIGAPISNFTASRASFTDGIQSFTSTASIADLIVDPRGDILKAGNTTTTPGLCYFLSGSNFIEANLGASSTVSGSMNNLLGIAVGTNSGTDGMLVKGFCNHNLNTGQAEVGKRFYVDSNGRFSGTPNSDPTLVRIAGYTIEGNGKIYFNPQHTTL